MENVQSDREPLQNNIRKQTMPIYSEQIKTLPGTDLLIGGFKARKNTGRMYFADITENKDKTADYALYSYTNQYDKQKLVYSKFNMPSFYAAYKFAKNHVLKKIGEN